MQGVNLRALQPLARQETFGMSRAARISIAAAVAVLTLLARMLGLAALLSGGLGFLVARPLLLWRLGGSR